MSDLEGRHVAVTGGTGGLGPSVVEALLEQGAICHLACLNDRERGAAPESDRVHAVAPVDVADESQVVSFYERFSETPLWASIHIAGGFAYASIEDVSAEDLRRQLETNVVTCFLACRESVKAMRRHGNGGRIVNVAARPALFPELGANMVAYTASKAGVAGITEALGAEVGGEGIWVNAVVPSIIDTPANRRAMPEADHDSWASPEEIARTILFLASPENRATRCALVPVYGRS